MRKLGRIFQACCRENHASWVNHLSNIEDCLNYIPHISTGFSPYEILYGRRPPNPLDAVTSVSNEVKGVYNMTNLKFYHRRDE
ncbi:hypothetical protein MTP99_004920 [Tenebrio molitor]|nr:hypothetical protein MTP99_004920 [Tenebrio molitor]